jgi:hypothetical protein
MNKRTYKKQLKKLKSNATDEQLMFLTKYFSNVPTELYALQIWPFIEAFRKDIGLVSSFGWTLGSDKTATLERLNYWDENLRYWEKGIE